MGVNFDWQVDEDAPDVGRRKPARGPRRPWALFILIIIGGGAAAVWGWGRLQIIQARNQTQSALQQVLDDQATLWNNGRIEQFLDQSPPNAVWQAEQFRAENIAFWQGQPEVTDFERQEGEIWANVRWTAADGSDRQRALFFEERGGEMILSDSAYRFWGTPRHEETPWGGLRLYESDLIWRDQIINTLAGATVKACGAGPCRPVEVELSNRFSVKADVLSWPSPRLWGLDPDGAPPQAYWEALETAVIHFLHPQPFTFAVPASQVNLYRELAGEYAAQSGRGQSIDIIPIEQFGSEAELMAAVDGAFFVPSVELIQSGAVLELTDLAFSDTDFDTADYYEQIWQGGFWRQRMWLLPQSANLTLIYLDRELYRTNDLPLPGYTWTWDILWADAAVLLESGDVAWGLATPNNDWLYSLAYNAGNRCTDEVTINCSPRLREQDVAAALTVYAEVHEQVPSYIGLTPRQVAIAYQNEISLQTRRSAVWVDDPVQYEQNFLSRAALVLPYPGTGDFPGVTPLWVDGYVISSAAESPQAVWQWLDFLSHHYVLRTFRQIPSRPSVAIREGYWERLPDPLAEAMIRAFPYARPVLLAEREIFTDEMLVEAAAEE